MLFLYIDTENFSWGSEAVTRKTRLLDVVYNASNNDELVRTQTLVKSVPLSKLMLHHSSSGIFSQEGLCRGDSFLNFPVYKFVCFMIYVF
jgi:hypothetical protein